MLLPIIPAGISCSLQLLTSQAARFSLNMNMLAGCVPTVYRTMRLISY